MKKIRKTTRLLIASGVLCIANSALAEDVYVKLPTANVLAGKSAGTDHLLKLQRGEKLQLIAREGSWLKVKSGNTEGYVHQNSVSTSQEADTSGLSKALAGGSNASGASSAAAGRGDFKALEYANSKGMSPAGLQRMIALRQSVTGSEYTKFTAEGNVGPDKK